MERQSQYRYWPHPSYHFTLLSMWWCYSKQHQGRSANQKAFRLFAVDIRMELLCIATDIKGQTMQDN